MVKKLLLIFYLLFANSVYASSSYGLYDFNNLKYEESKDVDQVQSIASITKLFTAYAVVMSGADLDEKVKVQGKSNGRFLRGSFVERKDLLRAMLMSSDNLAAESLAHAHPNGYEAFLEEVNWHLKVNGFQHTHIVDATGLLPGNVSTVSELKEFLFMLRNINIITFYSREQYYEVKYYPPKSKKEATVQLRNTNPQLSVYNEIILTKTGFTNAAGRCLAMLVERGGKLYAMITLGNRNVDQRSRRVSGMFTNHIYQQ